MGTSLWLVPDPETSSKLRRIMDKTTSGATSPSSYPIFHPHLTLTTVPSTTPESVLRDAIETTQVQVPITFKSVDVGPKYFMSVYAQAQRTPELIALRAHLSSKLGEKTVPPIPHMSMFYIDDADAGERQKLADLLREEGRVVDAPGGGSVLLDCSEGEERGVDVLGGFGGKEIWVMVCDGHPREWKRKGEVIYLK
ncbi:hypothetical protein EIP91_001675 [Steccherinum ochraceum]|uniref:2',3'-cyclic-nucleotide 3'-phosphodiesterase n=1 Tax=Steccherinum ochraceum TaxID=92696 RepID=A0A4R0RDL1_9APHY|nr:hypothetical protein EIP91_001675 [Steccherinum ochraceum]